METITERALPVRSDDVVHFPSGDVIYLHHLLSGEYFALNEVGGEVWELCDGALSISAIADRVAGVFAVARDDVLKDVMDLVGDLYREECVTLR